MVALLTEKDIEDGKRISAIFKVLDEDDKNQAIVYLSALRDRKMISESRNKVVEEKSTEKR